MVKFANNNANNANSGHTPFELNCGYYSWILYKENVDFCFKSKLANKLSAELKELMIVYQKNLHYTQKLRKQVYNKGVKPKNYAPNNKVWLNSKYIKTKQNRKLKAKFFRSFWALHPVSKQAYKLELLRK